MRSINHNLMGHRVAIILDGGDMVSVFISPVGEDRIVASAVLAGSKWRSDPRLKRWAPLIEHAILKTRMALATERLHRRAAALAAHRMRRLTRTRGGARG